MTFKTRCRVLALGAMLLSVPAAAQTSAGVDLGTLGGDSATAVQINVFGAIVGSSHTPIGSYRAFVMPTPGAEMVPLGPEALVSDGQGINDLNDVVFFAGQIFVQRGSLVRALGPLTATDVNNLGFVAGWRYADPNELHATVWDPSGTARDLGVAGQVSGATAINDRGQVAGWVAAEGSLHAVLWEADGTLVPLGTLGGDYSQAMAINEAGDIVGIAETATQSAHAFLWRQGIGMIDLDAGNAFSWAFGINDVGQIVGERFASGATHGTAFVWTQAAGMQSLATPTMPDGVGRASSINDLGEIVGSAADATRSRAFEWFVPPARDAQFSALARLVNQLAADGIINRGGAQSFTAQINAASRALAAGRLDLAGHHLETAARHLARADAGAAQGRIVHVAAFAGRLALALRP